MDLSHCSRAGVKSAVVKLATARGCQGCRPLLASAASCTLVASWSSLMNSSFIHSGNSNHEGLSPADRRVVYLVIVVSHSRACLLRMYWITVAPRRSQSDLVASQCR